MLSHQEQRAPPPPPPRHPVGWQGSQRRGRNRRRRSEQGSDVQLLHTSHSGVGAPVPSCPYESGGGRYGRSRPPCGRLFHRPYLVLDGGDRRPPHLVGLRQRRPRQRNRERRRGNLFRRGRKRRRPGGGAGEEGGKATASTCPDSAAPGFRKSTCTTRTTPSPSSTT